jgi:glucose/arabinose dehydrogenase
MRSSRTARGLALALVLLVPSLVGARPAFATKAVAVAKNLNVPLGFTFGPRGMLVYVERTTGWVRFRNLTTGADRRVYHVPNVDSTGERGALGVALHPAWPQQHFLYVYATRQTTDGLRNQVIRVRVERAHAVGTKVLLSIKAGPASNHNGGRILFGPGGKLFIIVGDGADSSNAQNLNTPKGKILRINPDGGIPPENPFRNRIWAYGIRNSFGFAFDRTTRLLWETENGPSCNDEVNLIRRGKNHGWGPNEDCTTGTSPTNTNNSGPAPRLLPKAWFVKTRALTGAAFCHACGLGPAFDGDLLVASYNDGVIRRFGLNAAGTDIVRGPGLVLDRPSGIVSMEVDPAGRVYFSDFSAIYRLVRG